MTIVMASGLATACGGSDDEPAAAPTPQTLATLCGSFAATGLPHGATQTRAELRAAAGTLPEVCIVRGTIVSSPNSTINWAVELPAPTAWNGKTLTVGGGGFDGFIPTDRALYQGLLGTSANPFVKMSSDSGHQTEDFYWATDETALRNHAFEANHQVLEVGTRIATAFYNKAPTRRYMWGLSNGGRSSMAAAQRYPKDYDGVIALAPAIAQEGFAANNTPLLFQHIAASPANWMSATKATLFGAEELKACDALDGLSDGILGNVAACNYLPTALQCTGAEEDTCFTAGQIETVRRIYSDRNVPVLLADGVTGYPRYGRGGASVGDWTTFLFGPDPVTLGNDTRLATQIARLIERNPAATFATHDPTLYAAEYLRVSSLIDATNPDLSAFADNGGKLLAWFGVSDSVISMYRMADYLKTVEDRLGASKVKGFVRFITSPSTSHFLNGPNGTTVQIDFVGLMDAWADGGKAPDNVVGTRLDKDGNAISTAPVCQYPKFPRYDGAGDPTKAESFVCSGT